MEISGNPPLSGQIPGFRARFAWVEDSDRARETSPQEESLRALKGCLKSLQATSSPKQRDAARVAQLKRQLDTMMDILRDTLPFLTPEQARNLVRQLKGIARELASIARRMNGGNGGGGGGMIAFKINITLPDAAAQSASQAEAAAGEAAQAAASQAREAQGASAVAETQAVEEAREADESGEAGGTDDGEGSTGTRGATASDRGLRKTLEEALLQLKALLSLLKSRLKDREGKKEAVAAEKYVAELEKELKQDVDAGTKAGGIYGAQGVPVAVDAPAAVSIDASA
jgi:hypothetical protein